MRKQNSVLEEEVKELRNTVKYLKDQIHGHPQPSEASGPYGLGYDKMSNQSNERGSGWLASQSQMQSQPLMSPYQGGLQKSPSPYNQMRNSSRQHMFPQSEHPTSQSTRILGHDGSVKSEFRNQSNYINL